jgi:hypothetical protein
VLDVVCVLVVVVLVSASVEVEVSFVAVLSEVLVLPQATSDRQIAVVNSTEIAFLFILKFLLNNIFVLFRISYKHILSCEIFVEHYEMFFKHIIMFSIFCINCYVNTII